MDAFATNKEDQIALESCICWEHVYDYLTDAGYTEVVLANPSRIHKDKRKTDKIDARKLSKLLHAEMLPESYAAPKDIRDHRQITRHKASLTVMRTMLKNRINAILLRNGIQYEYSVVFGKAGTEYLQSLDLEMRDRLQVDNYLSAIQHLNELIRKTS